MEQRTDLPPPRFEDPQLMLFETRLLNHGSCRHFAGDFMELATVAMVGGVRLRTSSQYVTCPDIHWKDNICFECKSIGKTRKAILYDMRIARDHEFTQRGYKLFYWLWRHQYKVAKSLLVSELNAGLAENLIEVVVVDFEDVYRWTKARPTRVMNTGYVSGNGRRVGWGTRGYGTGWHLSVSEMKELATAQWSVEGLEVQGERFLPFPIFGHSQMEFLCQSQQETRSGITCLLSSKKSTT